MDYEYHKLSCKQCGHKILVELTQFGISHVSTITVTCADCVVIQSDFAIQNPEDAKDIQEWIGEGHADVDNQM